MSDTTVDVSTDGRPAGHAKTAGLFGSLRDALAAAGKAEPNAKVVPNTEIPVTPVQLAPPPVQTPTTIDVVPSPDVVDIEVEEVTPASQRVSASDAARAARGEIVDGAPEKRGNETATPKPDSPQAPHSTRSHRHVEFECPPTTGVIRHGASTAHSEKFSQAETKLVRGRAKVERGSFEKDPVVGWLVVVGGPGLGNFRPIFEGNNAIGRSSKQRIAIDFGDDTISSEEQAYIRYDSTERGFLFVPNLAKTNIVSVNDKRPTGAMPLESMDVITIGRTQLVFVPFCGSDFDWSELPQS